MSHPYETSKKSPDIPQNPHKDFVNLMKESYEAVDPK